MILPICNYGDPVLRAKGAKIELFDDQLEQLIENMLETMDEAQGIGLAAQQIGQAVQLTVIDVSPVEDRPSSMKVKGEEVDPKDYMPLILINPELKPFGERVSGPEGCLSFPEVYDEVSRPESVAVKAQDEDGESIEFECGGLLARVVQHETDHLNGILFIDRMDSEAKSRHREAMEAIQQATKEALKKAREK